MLKEQLKQVGAKAVIAKPVAELRRLLSEAKNEIEQAELADAIAMHPDEMKKKKDLAERSAYFLNRNGETALNMILPYIHPELNLDEQDLLASGMGIGLAKHISTNKVFFSLPRMAPSDINKMHPSRVSTISYQVYARKALRIVRADRVPHPRKSSPHSSPVPHTTLQGMDAVENLAAFVSLPDKFTEQDDNGPKTQWKANLLEKIKSQGGDTDIDLATVARRSAYDGQVGMHSVKGRYQVEAVLGDNPATRAQAAAEAEAAAEEKVDLEAAAPKSGLFAELAERTAKKAAAPKSGLFAELAERTAKKAAAPKSGLFAELAERTAMITERAATVDGSPDVPARVVGQTGKLDVTKFADLVKCMGQKKN